MFGTTSSASGRAKAGRPMKHALVAKRFRSTCACAAVLVVTIATASAIAQAEPPTAAAAAADSPAQIPPTGPISLDDLIDLEASEAAEATTPEASPRGNYPAAAGGRMRPLEVIRESIFGTAAPENWQPLTLSTFFTDGWDRPYSRSPDGTNGAPKQNWFGASDGIFVRLNAIDFFFTDRMTPNQGLLLTPVPWAPSKPNTSGNEYFATYNLYVPLNQRLELLLVLPFVASNTTSPTGHYVNNFGDLTISERFRLVEQRNFSLQALLTERMPTGQTVNGNDINYITPGLEFWSNFAPRWVLRGGTSINIDTGRQSATTTYFNNVAIGRYLTTSDARLFKEAVFHLSASTLTDLLGRKNHVTDVYVTPGLRFSLGTDRKWAALVAFQVPLSAPRPFAFQPNLALVRSY